MLRDSLLHLPEPLGGEHGPELIHRPPGAVERLESVGSRPPKDVYRTPGSSVVRLDDDAVSRGIGEKQAHSVVALSEREPIGAWYDAVPEGKEAKDPADGDAGVFEHRGGPGLVADLQVGLARVHPVFNRAALDVAHHRHPLGERTGHVPESVAHELGAVHADGIAESSEFAPLNAQRNTVVPPDTGGTGEEASEALNHPGVCTSHTPPPQASAADC